MTSARVLGRAQPARDGFAFLDPANALLDGGGMGDSICRGRSAPADSAFDAGDELLLPVDLLFVELMQARPKLLVCLGVLELQRTLLVGGDHWYSLVHGAEDSPLCCRIDAVGQLGEAFVQPLPECGPRTGRGRIFDRAEAGDMLVPHPTVNPASFPD